MYEDLSMAGVLGSNERIRLLELAVEAGAPPFDAIATAQAFEAYVLTGQNTYPAETAGPEWAKHTPDSQN